MGTEQQRAAEQDLRPAGRLGIADADPAALRDAARHGPARAARASAAAASLADALGSPALRLGTLAGPRMRRSERIEAVDRFDDAFDAAWRRAEPHIACTQVRGTTFLNWRYVDCPVEVYRRRALYRDGALAGYSVLCVQPQGRATAGRVTDIFSYSGDTRDFALLLADANAIFREAGCTYSEVVFGRSDALDAAARRTGFLMRKEQRPIVMVLTNGESGDELAPHLQHLHMCRGDHDEDY